MCGLLAGGKVTAINGTQLTVQSKDGGSLTVDVTGATTYERAGVKSSLSAIHVGDLIAVQGTRSGNTIQATAIHIVLPMVAGTVTKVSGSNITIAGFNGTTRTVITSGSTTYSQPNAAKADASAVKVGTHILAQGTLSSDGKTLKAERILILPAGAPGVPGFRGAFRFHGLNGGPRFFGNRGFEGWQFRWNGSENPAPGQNI